MVRYTKAELEAAVGISFSITETLRNLNMCTTGGNSKTVSKYVKLWKISTTHFLTNSERAKLTFKKYNAPKDLQSVLTEDSSYARCALKARLYKEKLKQPICELCGQDENWNGKKMSLILDHINGINNDNRLENLRIVCPNCNSTLDTHAGKNLTNRKPKRVCPCGKESKTPFCSRKCYYEYSKEVYAEQPSRRKVERPSKEVLELDIKELPIVRIGKKYGVSDNAIRKWLKSYGITNTRSRKHKLVRKESNLQCQNLTPLSKSGGIPLPD